MQKIGVVENEAGVGTKAVDAPTLSRLMPRLAMRLLSLAGAVVTGKATSVGKEPYEEKHEYD